MTSPSHCLSHKYHCFSNQHQDLCPEDLKVEIFNQKQRNRNLTRNKKALKRDLRKYEKLNEEILDSNSWKITKPFRKILGVFRDD